MCMSLSLSLLDSGTMNNNCDNNSSDKSNLLWSIIALLVLSISVVAAYKTKLRTPTITLDSNSVFCDSSIELCTKVLDNGSSISLKIDETKGSLVQQLKIAVDTNNIDVSSVIVDFVSLEIDMGEYQLALVTTDNKHYKGENILPLCVSTEMLWQAQLTLQTPEGLVIEPFKFTIHR